MTSLVFIVIFIFCLAIAGACILISHQFIKTYNADFHKNYFYFLVSFYAFALYAIWGHLLLRNLLTGLNTRPEVMEAISNFSSILGLPFLFISWIMLINMAYSLFGKNAGKVWIPYHIALFVILTLGIWLGYDMMTINNIHTASTVRYIQMAYLSIFGLINYIVFITLVKRLAKLNKALGRDKIMMFSIMLVLAFFIQVFSSVFAFQGKWQLAVVILLFFSSNLFPLLYLRTRSDDIFLPVKAENSNEETLEQIVKRYHITKRERQIVAKICLGKTNQQIADELFISLQTVKDHTHRIYSKIGINSRMQLVQLVNQ
jgi:DNA-binding CsgD family transcriptional regulator